jgi:hypothetical protein
MSGYVIVADRNASVVRRSGRLGSTTYALVADSMADALDANALNERIIVAARQAINRTLDRARTAAARAIRDQVAFPASYLTGAESKLTVSQRASNENLEGRITGRQRATSLARFARESDPSAVRKKGGVTVQVKPGEAKFMKGAFLVKLRAGSAKTDTKFNLGIAIRLKPGESIRNKREMQQLDHNVYLLYGPSVDQVFNDVRYDIGPNMVSYLETEFRRLLDVRGA